MGKVFHSLFPLAENFILDKNWKEEAVLYVDEHQPFKLMCHISLQNDLSQLTLQWVKTGSNFFIGAALNLENKQHDFSHFKVTSAKRSDGGIYHCVINSTEDGNVAIDFSNRTTVRIRCMMFLAAGFY